MVLNVGVVIWIMYRPAGIVLLVKVVVWIPVGFWEFIRDETNAPEMLYSLMETGDATGSEYLIFVVELKGLGDGGDRLNCVGLRSRDGASKGLTVTCQGRDSVMSRDVTSALTMNSPASGNNTRAVSASLTSSSMKVQLYVTSSRSPEVTSKSTDLFGSIAITVSAGLQSVIKGTTMTCQPVETQNVRSEICTCTFNVSYS